MVNTDDINLGLRKRYRQPEWALFFNVANGTGARGNRYADAVGMSLFPSRGLEIHGFEVKISKSDWRREAQDPHKAESIAAYCDRWWVVTPPDLLANENIPPNWGWLAYDGKVFHTKKKAEQLKAKPLDRTFLAALLRRAYEANADIAKSLLAEKAAAMEAEIMRHVEDGVKARTRAHERLIDAVAAFEKASGIKIDHWDGGDIGKAVAVVRAVGANNIYRSAPKLANDLRAIASSIDSAVKISGIMDAAE